MVGYRDGGGGLSGTGCEGVGVMQVLLMGSMPPALPWIPGLSKNTNDSMACFWVLQQSIPSAQDDPWLPLFVKPRLLPRAEV